ncbi:hypothetical protein ACFL6S_03645 [Candidatus Poribacteria bacterium]
MAKRSGATGVTIQQRFALNEEVRTSIKLIEAGLGQLQRISGANDFYHLPMLTLANGFERLMKAIICLYTFREIGLFPDRSVFPRSVKGHDLTWLLTKITNECFDKGYVTGRQAAFDDIEYLCNDPQLRKLVDALSDFGQSARYYNLNIVLGENPATLSPKDQWERVERMILEEDDDWAQRLEGTDLDELYNGITTKLVSRLERFARALVRLFTIGGLGPEAKQYTAVIAPFLFLRDSDLGKRSY